MDDNTTLVLIFAVIFGCEALSRHLRTKQATAKQKQSNLALEAEIQQLNANQTQLIERIQTIYPYLKMLDFSENAQLVNQDDSVRQ
ncbi:hypothetical protein JQC92_07255 [Shewanella sp. 202IG2-18]|uniref:hypothetical protein n=1 Tax=Parashewanella hymeniacidonis TaxID=2807618 RepID=UPI00196144FE|nr:hypothetical protein [Parashewanella hymeniacidonis]MBM7071838.1 hypothetical protein [Parashewanella hymeniacidonis]